MAKIIINKGKPTERTVPLEFETTTIGRASDNVVVLPELYISRQHLIIEKRTGGYFANNLSSTTGTLVNQQRVEEALLKSGDVIQIGETTINFELDPADERTMIFEQQTVVMPAAPPTALQCPKCNTVVLPTDIFCGSCGASLKALAPGPPRPPVAPVPPASAPRESYSDPQLKVPMAPSAPPPAPMAPPQAPAMPRPPMAQSPAPPLPPGVLPVPPVAPPPPRPAAGMPPRPSAPAAMRPMPGAANYLSYPKAGFGVRLVAYIIDSVILTVIGAILIGVPALIFILPALGSMGRRGDIGGALGAVGALVMFAGAGLYVVISLLYVLWYWAKKGCTPGKKMMGLRIITQNGDCPIGWGPAFLRFLGYMVNGMIANLGFFFILFDAEKRGLHDMIAKTYVVKVK